MSDKYEQQYRQRLGERIERMTGRLEGEGKGLWSLNTRSLEKVSVYDVKMCGSQK